MAVLELTVDKVTEVVSFAWKAFIDSDMPLLVNDVNERSISHRLAIHLEMAMRSKGWPNDLHVDCEYNRDVRAHRFPYSKTLDIHPPQRNEAAYEDTNAVTVFPDIIVHKRGTSENYLVIEIKKEGRSKQAEEFDTAAKLPAYRTQLGYQCGVFLVLGVLGNSGKIVRFLVLDRRGEWHDRTHCGVNAT